MTTVWSDLHLSVEREKDRNGKRFLAIALRVYDWEKKVYEDICVSYISKADLTFLKKSPSPSTIDKRSKAK